MKVDSYKCDSCGLQKGENNHWFKSLALERGNGPQFIVSDWNEPDSTDTKHLCSDACVIKTMQGWLSAQKEASQKGE